MTADDTPCCGLCNSGSNLCMTNNPNLLVDVCQCAPFTISLATSNGGHSHTNVCRRRGLLPLPLINGTAYYQTCFVNPYASETFISPQAIINSSNGSFDKWQMKGFLQGCMGILLQYSPSGLLKMSFKLCQQDGLYYSMTNMFTVDTNPPSWYSPFAGSTFTELAPSGPDVRAPRVPRSWVLVCPTNLACQLESELWAACLGHCGKDQLIALANQADGLPNTFKFHPFQHIKWKVQARIHKSAAR
jgi:hypothetical protein